MPSHSSNDVHAHASAGRVAMRLVFPVLQAAEQEGVPRARVLGDIALPSASDPAEVTASLSLHDYFVLLERAEDAVRDPGFVLRAAGCVDPQSFGAVGFACMTSPTLGEAFHRAARYHVVCTDAAHWWRADVDEHRPGMQSTRPSRSGSREAGAKSAIVFEQRGPERRGRDAAVEFALAEMLCHSRFLTREWVEPIETRFAHGRPSHSELFDRFFGGRVLWSASRNEMVVPTELLERPIPQADPHLLAYFDRQSESLLARVGEPGIAADVLDAIIRALPSGTPSIDDVTVTLGMSPRTLRRRLAEQGDTFQGLLEKARQTMAARYLERSDLSIGEIAFLLGFSEPSPFYRAFRRWFGRSPEQYRSSKDHVP